MAAKCIQPYTQELVMQMKSLVNGAYLTPNLTGSLILTGIPLRWTDLTDEQVDELLDALSAMGKVRRSMGIATTHSQLCYRVRAWRDCFRASGQRRTKNELRLACTSCHGRQLVKHPI